MCTVYVYFNNSIKYEGNRCCCCFSCLVFVVGFVCTPKQVGLMAGATTYLAVVAFLPNQLLWEKLLYCTTVPVGKHLDCSRRETFGYVGGRTNSTLEGCGLVVDSFVLRGLEDEPCLHNDSSISIMLHTPADRHLLILLKYYCLYDLTFCLHQNKCWIYLVQTVM